MMMLLQHAFAVLLLAASSLGLAIDHTWVSQYGVSHNETLVARADPKDFYLRIMPLGASITAGDYPPPDDPSKNGYRKFLRDKLRSEGWKVNMVGNRNSGTMADNDHEGVSGDRVSQVRARTTTSTNTWLPNVVLINAGTNDAVQEGSTESVSGAPLRMKELINAVFAEVPKAVVVLSTLLPQQDHQASVDSINQGYRQIYRDYVPLRSDGSEEPNPQFKVILLDFDGFITNDDIQHGDNTHPTTSGNKKMAAGWDWAIGVANDRGWIQQATDSGKFSDSDGSTTCRKEFGSGAQDTRSGRQILFARGAEIHDDGNYVHKSQLRDDRAGKFGDYNGDRMGSDSTIWFAQLVNLGGSPKLDERDELIVALSDSDLDDDTARKFVLWVNDGVGNYQESHYMDVPDSCSNNGVRWGDVNGDGLDDFICLFANGEMHVSINKGGNPPTFQQLGLYKGPELGMGRDNVRFGDMDGDGRLDYCVIDSGGNVHCWRNGGIGDRAEYWQDMGSGQPIFLAKGKGDIRGVELVDINGDGRYDWVWVSTTGECDTYINQRGDGKGMIPYWRAAGITHPGVGVDIGGNREHIKWNRMVSGRPSYVHWTQKCPPKTTPCEINWQVWENLGAGGKFQKGDGIYFGDATGNGFDDYFWIDPDGLVNLYHNKYNKDYSQADLYVDTAWGIPIQINTGVNRRGLHIGDWNGDGLADIIAVTNLATGSLKVWINNWDGSNHNWAATTIADPGRSWCTQGFGTLYRDRAHHFADITGSGRVSYICMAPSGQAWAWLRDENGENPSGQIKYSEDLDRANFMFADVNGDGKADLLWLDKFTGDTKVWYWQDKVTEADRAGNSGSIIKWERPQTLFQGASRGTNTFYPSLQGQRRADMVWAEATTAHAFISFNSCPAGGDDGGVTPSDPGLPSYTPPGGGTTPDDPTQWFCDGNGASWDPDLWQAHGVGTWLVERCDLYSAIDQSWPSDQNVHGVPRVIAEYDVYNHDEAFNWPPECLAIDSHNGCGLDSLGLDEDCPNNQERAFSLWAMQNFAKFLQTWFWSFESGVNLASKSVGEIGSTFLSVKEEDNPPTSPAAWLTIVAGMFTSIAAWMPGAAQMAGNFGAGLLTAGAGVASFYGSATEEPSFDNYSEMQAALGRMQIYVHEAMAAYFNRMLSETPPNNDRDQGSALAHLLESGVWADQDFAISNTSTTADGTPVVDGDRLGHMIMSAMISETWNTEQVAIATWSRNNWIASTYGWNPCDNLSAERYGMDHAIACQNDKNYMIVRVPDTSQNNNDYRYVYTVPKIGQDEDSLKDYGLNHASLIGAAERIQGRASSFIPRGLDGLSDFILSATDQPGTARADHLFYINVPVCDLDQVGTIDHPGQYCDKVSNGDAEDSIAQTCIVQMFDSNCHKLRLGSSDWPYKGP